MDRSRQVVSFILIVVSILGLFSWEKWGRDRFLYDDVPVLRQDVDPGTPITESMLTTAKMENVPADALSESDLSDIIGTEAGQYIHRGVPLFAAYFSESGLTADAGLDRYVMTIPEGWIASMPSSISRGDHAVLYLDDEKVAEVPVRQYDTDGNSLEVMVTRKEAKKLSGLGAMGRKFSIIYYGGGS